MSVCAVMLAVGQDTFLKSTTGKSRFVMYVDFSQSPPKIKQPRVRFILLLSFVIVKILIPYGVQSFCFPSRIFNFMFSFLLAAERWCGDYHLHLLEPTVIVIVHLCSPFDRDL